MRDKVKHGKEEYGVMRFSSDFRNMIRYSIIGMTATAVEWITFFILNVKLGMPYIAATVIAMIISIFANWVTGRIVMFRGTGNVAGEIGKVYLTGITGISFNLFLMWVMAGKLKIPAMVSKVIATLIVFVWNYTITTKVIYKGKIKSG